MRAGLEIAAAVRSLETRGTERLAVRIGIATGLVVVGDLVGEGSAQEQAVVGETPNLAARLQALAQPGQLVIAGATRRLIGDLFRLRDLGRQTAKGFAEPVEAFVVEDVAVTESRFEAARRGLTDLVGRAAESALLRDRLREAWAGAGQIDEAYVDFGAETAIPLVASHPNLLVVQTMSKSRALAGLRIGYAIGDADLIEALTRVKDSFNSYPLGRPAQAGAIASLEDEAYFQQSRARVIEGRVRLNRGLVRLGFEVLPSSANFVFARHPAREGAALAAALRQRAVIVRYFPAPRISDYLRITVGTDAQIDRLLSTLSDILGSEPASA